MVIGYRGSAPFIGPESGPNAMILGLDEPQLMKEINAKLAGIDNEKWNPDRHNGQNPGRPNEITILIV